MRSRILWGLLAISVVLATYKIARAEIHRSDKRVTASVRTVANGARFAATGIVTGDTRAPVRVVVFWDFECRYCRRFKATLDELLARQPTSVAIVYRHFPISRVGFSVPAAIAAECAAQQGRFDRFSELLFAAQDTLRRLSFEVTAVSADVHDTAAFHACRADPATRRRVDEDVRTGVELGIAATPSVLVGNELFAGEMRLENLEALVRHALTARIAR
jgi:protein-disulfide isomerase